MGTGEILGPETAGGRAVTRNPWIWMITGLVFAFAGAMLLSWVVHNLDPGQEMSRPGARIAVTGGEESPAASSLGLTLPSIYSLRYPLQPDPASGKAYRIPWASVPPVSAGLPLPAVGSFYRPWLRPVLPPVYLSPRLGAGRVLDYELQPVGMKLMLPPRLRTPLLAGVEALNLALGLTPASDTEGDESRAPKEIPGGSGHEDEPAAGVRNVEKAGSGNRWVMPRPAVVPVFGIVRPAKEYSPIPPNQVRGVHASSNQAGSPRMDSIVDIVSRVGLNAIVVEIKDEYGRLAYQSQVPLAREIGAGTNRIPDVRAFLSDLHDRGFYVIARMVTFQDGVLATARPHLAIKNRTGGLWRNRQNLAWVDPGRAEVWQYQVDIAEEALQLGFDEVQFDYVRFPTDGDVSNMRSVVPEDRRVAAIGGFLAYARQRLAPYGRPISADVFGFVATAQDDLGIGQRLEEVAASVDFVSPMVYPSHYPKGSYGIEDPDAEPYAVIRHAMEVAVGRIGAEKLRPWLQSFSLRHTYGPDEIAAQIRAVSESGIGSWLFWNASGRYDLLEAGIPRTW
ncbi:MAG: putative glycoside hydrolase [Limnochordales bacterium]|nr:putative glycoside hydrolase [Limnochordales bacterium]